MLSAGFGSICLILSTYPPFMLQNFCPFCFIFDLAIIAAFVSFIIILHRNVEVQSMARPLLYFVWSPLTFCIPVGLTKHVHEYKIGSCSYWEPFGCSAFEKKSSIILATWPRLAVLLTATVIFGWARALCNSNFWLDASSNFLKKKVSMWNCVARKPYIIF